jgi:hypothetical protein
LNRDTFDFDTASGTVASPSVSAVSPVPEPGSLTLLGIGALCMSAYGWRQRRRKLT